MEEQILETTIVNKNAVERIYPDDKRVKPQTIAHHKARYQFATQIQEAKGRSLDLACGTGYGTEMLRKAGYNAKGIDISPEAYEFARKSYPQCDFLLEDILKPEIFRNPYQLITMFEAIEHFPYMEGVKLIERLSNFVLKDGFFILSTPKDTNDKYNTFHKSEWGYATIKNICGSYFENVKIYGQDWDTAEISDDNVRNNDFYIAVCQR